MDDPTSGADALASLVQHYYATHFALVSSAGWLSYDYIMTFDQEVELVWMKPWSFAKAFFFWTRYVGMAILVAAVSLSLLATSPQLVCPMFFDFCAWGGVVTMATVSTIMILRLYAMYTGNKKIAAILAFCFVCHLTATCVIFGTGKPLPFIPSLDYLELGLNACFVGGTPPQFLGLWISRLIFDSILLGFALFKSYEQYQAGWHSGLVDLLIRDNVMAFGLVFLIQIVNLLLSIFGPLQTSELGVGFALATDVIVGSRLLLRTRQAVYNRDGFLEDSDPGHPLSRLDIRVPASTDTAPVLSISVAHALWNDDLEELDDIEPEGHTKTQLNEDEEDARPRVRYDLDATRYFRE